MALQHLRSSTASKRPTPASMSDGQLAINTNLGSPGLFFKDSSGALVKVGPVHVGTTAPNASPAVGGQAGNSVGEQWLDTSSSRYVFKIWDGTAWRSENGEFVDAAGDVMTGALGIIAGTAAAPGLYVSGDTDTGLYSPGADQVAISTGGTGRVFVNNNGSVTVNAGSTPDGGLTVFNTGATDQQRISVSAHDYATTPSYSSVFLRYNGASAPGTTAGITAANTGELVFQNNTTSLIQTNGSPLVIATISAERLRVAPDGKVGIGTSAPGALLHLRSSAARMFCENSSTGDTAEFGVDGTGALITAGGAKSAVFYTNGTERFRCDSSGRLLVGTSTGRNVGTQNWGIQQEGTTFATTGISTTRNSADAYGSYFVLGKTRGTTVGATTVVQAGDELGGIIFAGADGTTLNSYAASILAYVDAAPGTNDMPGRLVFSTTADGASSPTERMRIDNTGAVSITTGDLTLYGYGGEGGQLLLNNPTNTVTTFTVDVLDDTNGRVFTVGNNVNLQIGQLSGTGGSILFHTAVSERARIDSSGRLLVGTSAVKTSADIKAEVVNGGISISRYVNDAFSNSLAFTKSRGSANGTIVQAGDQLGPIQWLADDGSATNKAAAYIDCYVDGAPGVNSIPGRIVLATTASGASTLTEQWRLNNAGTVIYNQPAPAAVNTTATLTVANLTAKIITSTTAAAVTMTLPLGTDMDTGFSGLYTNMAFEWYVINTGGTNAVTVAANTAHTIVGSGTVSANNSGKFLSRRTAATTWVTYRLSS